MAGYARAHVMRDSLFEVDGVDYANQVWNVRLVPTQESQTRRTLSPSAALVDNPSATWQIEIEGVQDFGTGSFGAVLRAAAAAGESLPFTYQPKLGTGQDVAEGEFKPTHIPFGGAEGEWRTFNATFALDGEPNWSQSVA